MSKLKCPNCGDAIDHVENGCVLASLIQVIRDRQTMSESKLRKLHAKVDVDAFWNDIGTIIDNLEEGEYSNV